jgi:MGT family glycosyltransferase
VTTILFLPNYLGGGFGHIGRCIALAQAFHKRGDEVSFAINGPHVKTVSEVGFATHILSTPRCSSSNRQGPAYIYVPELSYQIVRDGFDNYQVVKTAIREVLNIIMKTKPDILIGDGYALTYIVGRLAGIPVVQFVKSAVHPDAKAMVWWEEEPEGLLVPDIRPVFNPILEKLKLPQISKRALELFSGDLLLLPSIPVLDPMDPFPSNTFYIGPIIRTLPTSNSSPQWLTDLSREKPVVYVTVGGAAGSSGLREFFQIAVKAFEAVDWQIVLSTGGKIDPQALDPVPEHIKIVRWAPGTETIARSDLVVFHGGYTRMEILMHGLPSVVIPFHSEQEYYGRVMEQAGVSRLIHYSDEPYQRAMGRWKGGNRWLRTHSFSIHVKKKITLLPEILRSAAEQCLYSKNMRHKAERLKSELKSYGGCDKAVDLIKDNF